MATVSIRPLDANKAEGNSGATPFTFVVQLDAPIETTQTVEYAVAQSTRPAKTLFQPDATPDDFVGGAFPTGTVTFLPGETSKVITIDVAGDLAFESLGAAEEFAVFLSNPSSGLTIDPDSKGGPNPPAGFIYNDETETGIFLAYMFPPGGGPPFIYTTATQVEGDSGTIEFSFLIKRFGVFAPGSVTYTVSGFGDNPASASDFVGGFPQGVVTFAENEGEKYVHFSIISDTEFEPTESFAILLSNPTVGTIGATTAYGIVIDDDAPVVPTVAVPDTYVVVQDERFINYTAPVRTNDLNGDVYTRVTVESLPSHGSLNWLLPNGAFSYTPSAGFSGVDSFTYRASDGLPDTSMAEVTIRVVPVNAGAVPTLNLAGLTPEEQIAAVYIATLGRAADAGGLDYWVGQLTQGASLHDIAASFVSSDEAEALHHGVKEGSFVTVSYKTLFNRVPDDLGLAYWVPRIGETLASGESAGSILIDMVAGANDYRYLDIWTLMQKVTVSLAYVQAQRDLGSQWTLGDDRDEAVSLLTHIGSTPDTLLVGIALAKALVAADVV